MKEEDSFQYLVSLTLQVSSIKDRLSSFPVLLKLPQV